MTRWPIWLLFCCAVSGCVAAKGPIVPVLGDCPSPSPCDDPDTSSLSPIAQPVAYRPLWPGCPGSLQVMARLRSIVFRALRPDGNPDSDSDPADWSCDSPEAPLLRAARPRAGQAIAAR